MLEPVGLTTWEERLYLALLESGPMTVPEIADRLGIERRRASALVRGLERAGLATRTPGRQPRIVPAPPELAVTTLILQRQQELQEVASAVGPLAEQYRRTPRERSAGDLIELCVGREAGAARFEQLQRSAVEQVRVLDMPPYAVDPAENITEFDLLRKGIRYRVVYHTDALREPGSMAALARCAAAGEEARVSALVPLKLVISDDALGLVPFSSGSAEMSCILVHSCGLLDSLAALFELLWARARPVVAGVAPFDQGHVETPTHDDRRLLSLLLAGLTDAAAARELGVSPRTFQRRLQNLMIAAAADNRLQLGWHAHAQGWIRPRSGE